MHPRSSARRPLAILVLALALVAGGARVPAAAHTEVLRSSPGPGEEVSKPVRSVELTFLDPVEPDVTIEIRRGTGEAVAGVGPVERSEDGRAASITFPALTGTGDYVVEYRFSASDGDTSRESYRFTLLSSDDGDGTSSGALAGAVGLGIVVAAGIVVALRRRTEPG